MRTPEDCRTVQHRPNALLNMQAGFVSYRTQWTPTAADRSAPHDQFSEARALEHVHKLTVAGRLVSHPGIEAGAVYLLEELSKIANVAAASENLVVQVFTSEPHT